MSEKAKTSTFTIHHDRCDPSKWTPRDVMMLAEFISRGSMQHAASLARLGMQLVTSEHHIPAGGELEHIGAAKPGVDDLPMELDDLVLEDGEDVVAFVQVYRGPVQYAATFAIGDAEGNVEGHEIEVFKTESEARDFLESLRLESVS